MTPLFFVGALFVILGIMPSLSNWSVLIRSCKGVNAGSFVPYFIGIFMTAGLMLMLPDRLDLLSLAGLIIDGGSVPKIIGYAGLYIKRKGNNGYLKGSDIIICAVTELVIIAVLTFIAMCSSPIDAYYAGKMK